MLGIFLDTETNGLNWTKHVATELAFIIVDLYSGEVKERYQTLIKITQQEWEQSDPASLEFTKITLDEINSGKPVDKVRQEIVAIFKNHNIARGKAVFICQNPGFDRIFFSKIIDVDTQERLKYPYYWLDLASMYWSKMLSQGEDPRSLTLSKDSIAKRFKLPPEDKPHRAMQGTEHLLQCYTRVIGFHTSNNHS